jgi:hypothetical protein
VPDITKHSTKALELELKRRAREAAEEAARVEAALQQQPQRAAIAAALRAAAVCVENPPNVPMHLDQLQKASRLTYELVYHTLPGGSGSGRRDVLKTEPSPKTATGMDAGWIAEGILYSEDEEPILNALDPRHTRMSFRNGGPLVPYLTMEEKEGR